MKRAASAALLIVGIAVAADRREPASRAELDGITKRGQLLAEYDRAAWLGTDAVLATKPDESKVTTYLARETDSGWTVAFGRLSPERDRFLIAYEAMRPKEAQTFEVKRYEPPRHDTGFLLSGARAVEIARADFKGQDRPYNVAVLPDESGGLYVYMVPAQTKHGVFPLGADVRYRISGDGLRILEKHQMHISVIEFSPEANVVAGTHSAVLDDAPEDTDVFHVLVRQPAVPEYIGTPKFVYKIDTDGSIHYIEKVKNSKEPRQK